MSPEVIRWLDMAKQDEAVAEHLLESFRPVPVEIICYHCQQAAEKAIKALLIAQGVDSIPRSHDLSFLLNGLVKPEVIPERVYEDADRLTPYGVAVRYPNDLELEERHARQAMEAAREVLNWAKSIMIESQKH